MAISTADLRGGDVMVNVASLLNDPDLTDYTPEVMTRYLNLAIEELNEHLAEANISLTNQVSQVITILKGDNKIINPPIDIIEIQELGERAKGSNDSFINLPRKEFPENYPPSSSLLFWCYQGQKILFNPNGATTDREVQLKYICSAIKRIADQYGVIGSWNASSFLSYKTAALLSQFVGENETRSGILNEQAELALERIVGISNKGKQQIMTRHRPFRAGYKSRGY